MEMFNAKNPSKTQSQIGISSSSPFNKLIKNSTFTFLTRTKGSTLSNNSSNNSLLNKVFIFDKNKKIKIKNNSAPIQRNTANNSNENNNTSPKLLQFSNSLSKLNKVFNKRKFNQYQCSFLSHYPLTTYQKISKDITKIKIRTDLALNAMKKNVKMTDRHLYFRASSALNILNLKKVQNNENKRIKSTEIRKNIKISPRRNEKFQKTIELIKVPLISLKKIKNIKHYTPLNKRLEMERNFYKNMYHNRNFLINTRTIDNKVYQIYNTPSIFGLSNYIKEPEIQLKSIYNKIKLIIDNINYFKTNFMYKKEFNKAFSNMENQQKADFNIIVEEISGLLIKIIPPLLKSFYESIDQLLFINIPTIDKEMENLPSNEIECLKYNFSFLNKVSEYFSASTEIFNVVNKQITEFKYKNSEFHNINIMLDLARYDTSSLISMANTYIKKAENDQKTLINFEVGLKLRKKKIIKKKEIDDFQRFHNRHKFKVREDNLKIDRINSALNFMGNIYNKVNKEVLERKEKKEREKIRQRKSVLEIGLIRNMMKYFNKNIKEKIISQQVIERYKTRELKRLGQIDEDDSSSQ